MVIRGSKHAMSTGATEPGLCNLQQLRLVTIRRETHLLGEPDEEGILYTTEWQIATQHDCSVHGDNQCTSGARSLSIHAVNHLTYHSLESTPLGVRCQITKYTCRLVKVKVQSIRCT